MSFDIFSVDFSAHVCTHTLQELVFLNNESLAIRNAAALVESKAGEGGFLQLQPQSAEAASPPPPIAASPAGHRPRPPQDGFRQLHRPRPPQDAPPPDGLAVHTYVRDVARSLAEQQSPQADSVPDVAPAQDAPPVHVPPAHLKSSPKLAWHLLANRRSPAPQDVLPRAPPKPAGYTMWRPKPKAPTAAASLLCSKPKYAAKRRRDPEDSKSEQFDTHVEDALERRRLQIRGLRMKLRNAFPKGKVRPRSPEDPPSVRLHGTAQPARIIKTRRVVLPKPRPKQPDVPPPAHLVNAWKQRAKDAAAKVPPPVKRAPAACRLLSTSSSSSSSASSNSCVESRVTLKLCRDQYLQDLL